MDQWRGRDWIITWAVGDLRLDVEIIEENNAWPNSRCIEFLIMFPMVP